MFRSKIQQLQEAILRDDTNATLAILKDPKEDIQFPNNPVHNLLSFAAKERRSKTLQCLASKYADLALPRRLADQTHPIHFEAAAGNDLMATSLLENDPSLFFLASKKLYTPIELAAMAYKFDTVANLLAHRAFGLGNFDQRLKIVAKLREVLTEYHFTENVPAPQIGLSLQIVNLMQLQLLRMSPESAIKEYGLLQQMVTKFFQTYQQQFLSLQGAAPRRSSVNNASDVELSWQDEEADLGVNPQETERLKQCAEGFGFQFQPIARDGNCLFEAIVDQLNFNQINQRNLKAAGLRALAVSHMSAYQELYQDSIPGDFQLALNKFALQGTFGDHQHLLAIGRVMQLQIVVLNSDQDIPQASLNVPQPLGLICLGYEARNSHYHSLRLLKPNDIIKDIISNMDIDPFLLADKYSDGKAQLTEEKGCNASPSFSPSI